MKKLVVYVIVYFLYVSGITTFFVNYFNVKNSGEIFNVVVFSTISLLFIICVEKLNQNYGAISERGYFRFMKWSDEEIEQYKLDMARYE